MEAQHQRPPGSGGGSNDPPSLPPQSGLPSSDASENAAVAVLLERVSLAAAASGRHDMVPCRRYRVKLAASPLPQAAHFPSPEQGEEYVRIHVNPADRPAMPAVLAQAGGELGYSRVLQVSCLCHMACLSCQLVAFS